MRYDEIYKVGREDYKAFVEQIEPEFRRIDTIKANNFTDTRIFSKNTNELLCARISWAEDMKKPEEYYIINMPEDYERRAPIPKLRLNLETREEVQAFFNAISRMNKVNSND